MSYNLWTSAQLTVCQAVPHRNLWKQLVEAFIVLEVLQGIKKQKVFHSDLFQIQKKKNQVC